MFSFACLAALATTIFSTLSMRLSYKSILTLKQQSVVDTSLYKNFACLNAFWKPLTCLEITYWRRVKITSSTSFKITSFCLVPFLAFFNVFGTPSNKLSNLLVFSPHPRGFSFPLPTQSGQLHQKHDLFSILAFSPLFRRNKPFQRTLKTMSLHNYLGYVRNVHLPFFSEAFTICFFNFTNTFSSAQTLAEWWAI